MIKGYRDLKVWQESHSLCKRVYAITNEFDSSERFALTQQMRRAAYSVPMNIAEGKAYSSIQKYIFHLEVAKGSNSELDYQLLLSFELGYIESKCYDELSSQTDHIGKMLTKLIEKLKKV